MSFLQGGFTLTNKTPLPAGVTKPAAIAALQDHASPPSTTTPSSSSPDYASYQVPPSITATALRHQVQVYEVHDHVPNPVWSSDVTSLEEFVDCAEGIWVRVRSPLGIVLETTWFICEKKRGKKDERDGLELVQTLVCTCNRLLASLTKAQVEKGWQQVHEKLIQAMVEDRTAAATAGAAAVLTAKA
ncbi:uncharacterized protein PG986_013817 [Apiospora aurea]|uniref:DUF7053 domain-containing protein n=1 Tax=Apiospora aurea TaxID=335848 RepID=A0ABR1PWP7_9PEZI